MNILKTNHLSILFLCVSMMLSCSSKSSEEKSNERFTNELTSTSAEQKIILFFGNSLSAGYGIDEEESFPGLVASEIDSLKLPYKVINGGLSGETTASGLSRLDWFLEDEPYIFVLELGGNDGLRGISLSESKKNLKSIIQLVRSKYPETHIILAGMQIPPNMGREYTEEFRQMYPQIAQDEKVTLIPFLLEGVAGNPDLNLPDGIHPTAEGHKIIFQNIWPYIEERI
ncbi:arylesterase [Belliella kenyensis]|uniref:Arylesterase n=1 Tax=Belliella kenyensis TaxID=1472724 RepID=A0ABV8EPS6_9BACT|nr:arylesterase [Belliella kenyensis]MCH7403597.1 arylesterase [Belliella kenyensis]MDN3603851.1 arylesterase [Belliella kenyensis]